MENMDIISFKKMPWKISINLKKNIFITGGAGYIGSHCAISLINNGYTPIIIDNLTNSFSGVIKKIEIITFIE